MFFFEISCGKFRQLAHIPIHNFILCSRRFHRGIALTQNSAPSLHMLDRLSGNGLLFNQLSLLKVKEPCILLVHKHNPVAAEIVS
jgi:hypothetical protein